MVLKNNGTEADAGDIFQEALVALYQKARQGNFELTCPLDAYLHMVCKNRWINELNRKTGKTVTFTDTEGYSHSEDVFKSAEGVMQNQERRNLLEEKINELGDGCQQVLKMSWSGLPMDEVAKQLQNTYGYIRKKKSECMAKLIALVKTSSQFTKLQW
jgi:RNA polymerase sigma factor (sigma-70 family)